MKPLACFPLILVLSTGNAQAQNSTPFSVWAISATERRALLQTEIGKTAQIDAESRHLSTQLTFLKVREAQAERQAKQAAADAFGAQQKANAALSDALNAAVEAGSAEGRAKTAVRNLEKQSLMLQEAVRSWSPPKQQIEAVIERPRLIDPFAAGSSNAMFDAQSEIVKALIDSCLELDRSHGVARARGDCSFAVTEQPLAGDYPVLEDGSLLDTPSRVKQFLGRARTRGAQLNFLRGDSQLITIR